MMFRRVRALMAKADAELNHAHRTMDSAELTLQLVRALIEDLQDGLQLTCDVEDEAAKKLAMIVLGNGGKFPLSVGVDPEWDTKPGPVARLKGGPYDGKTYQIPEEDMEDGDMTLKGGHRYKWDGKVFRYVKEVLDDQGAAS